MRHRSKTTKLKRNASHRRALLANLSCSLIQHGRIKTTLGKAKALRPVVEKLVTMAKRDDLHSRRLAVAFLRDKESMKKLFAEVAPAAKNRPGGYTRITKLGTRMTDSAPMAYIEWVDIPGVATDDEESAEQPAKTTKEKAKTTPAAEATEAAEAAEAAEPSEAAAPAADSEEEKSAG
jgi:large subunit ribosomal protein L17